MHDSQVAIPLATMTAARVTNLYDLMDSAYFGRVILKEVSAAYLLHKGGATEYQ